VAALVFVLDFRVPWEETIDGPALLDAIAGTLRRFVVLPAGPRMPRLYGV